MTTNITVGNHTGGLSSSRDGWQFDEFARRLEVDGYAIVERNWPRPINHRMIGVGVGHDDADFAEVGRSMAAYYENGDAHGGRWWEDTSNFFSTGVRYYGMDCRIAGRHLCPQTREITTHKETTT